MRITVFVHGSKEHCYASGEVAGLSGDALQMFKFAAYEHAIEYEVNPETGEALAVKIDGRNIQPKEQP